MTDTELALWKLRWRVEILEKFSIAMFAALVHSADRVPSSEFARVTMQVLDTVSKEGERLLLSKEVPEDERVLLSEEFAEVVKQVKNSFAAVLTPLP